MTTSVLSLNWPSFVAIILVVIAIVWTERRVRAKANTTMDFKSREQILEEEVRRLNETVATLLRSNNDLQRQIDLCNIEIVQLKARLTLYESPQVSSKSSEILVAIGNDPMLQSDLAALRKIAERSAGSVKVTRLSPVSLVNLKRTLDRHRTSGNPIRWVHIAAHAGPQGIVFSDGIATGQWLSENMGGVKILVINGCESDSVADWAGIVPHVISMREAIPNSDAANFCEAFWQGVAEGLDAEAAFDRALVRVPAVAEYAELHQ